MPTSNIEKQREYWKKYYYSNKDKVFAKAKAHDALQRIKLKEIIQKHLLDHPCVDCGESDPVVLEFDHVDPVEKKDNISTMVVKRVSVAKLVNEISKCEVRCCNCHRRKTAKQFNWNNLAQEAKMA